ncbi:MAG TPA: histidine--tRNA ligase [Actinomycetaceae bacterium]|nr:histidine--tRNA ligase [Actinomycetaceae bacterium]
MARTRLSGFPEWTPSGYIVEQDILRHVRRTFELHGFAGIETRAVEPLEDLLRKGETSKEVYVLRRLQEMDEAAEAELGLHFDLTVPLARYVLDNANDLVFPFKRYQIQKVWRGERPQAGRFREFRQADIDVIGQDTLPFVFEVEVAIVMAEALAGIPVGEVVIGVNNRKISQGFYEAIGIEDLDGTLRAVDKLAKIGHAGVVAELQQTVGATETQAEAALSLASIRGTEAAEVVRAVRERGARSELLDEGLEELALLLDAAARTIPGGVRADLSIARGLDYYTGTVYEATIVGHESFGAICAGGRYDSLVSDGKRTFPGVGLSLGISRIVSRILGEGSATATRPVPTAVLVAVTDEGVRHESDDVARELRARGIPAEVSPTAAKFGRQIRYADRRGIPFVWFPDSGEVKDIRSGEQLAADATEWEPPAVDLWPRVVTP